MKYFKNHTKVKFPVSNLFFSHSHQKTDDPDRYHEVCKVVMASINHDSECDYGTVVVMF